MAEKIVEGAQGRYAGTGVLVLTPAEEVYLQGLGVDIQTQDDFQRQTATTLETSEVRRLLKAFRRGR